MALKGIWLMLESLLQGSIPRKSFEGENSRELDVLFYSQE